MATLHVGVVTNPPYQLALEFFEKTLASGTQYSTWLLRLNFIESMKRKPFFEVCPPSRIHIISRRLPMIHRQNWKGPRSTSNHCYVWFVFDRRSLPDNRAQLNFVDWKDNDRETPNARSPCCKSSTFQILMRAKASPMMSTLEQFSPTRYPLSSK